MTTLEGTYPELSEAFHQIIEDYVETRYSLIEPASAES
jgi:hypothetical protein